jgi:MFS family permease
MPIGCVTYTITHFFSKEICAAQTLPPEKNGRILKFRFNYKEKTMIDSKAPAFDNGINQAEIKTTAYSWFISILCMAAFGVSIIARFVWTTAIPVAYEDLGINMAAAGGLMTAFFFGQALANFLTGGLVDRYGPKLIMALGIVFTGIFTIAIPFSSSYPVLFVLRVLAGACAGPIFAAMSKYQLSWFAPGNRATAMGIMMMAINVGSVFSNAVFAPVIQNKSWQHAFTYSGIIALAVGIIFFIFAKEKGIAALRIVRKQMTAEEKKEDSAKFKAVVFKKSFLIGTIASFLNNGASLAFMTYIMTFLTRVQGMGIGEAGTLLGGTYAVGIFAGSLSGITADLLKNKKLTAILGGIAMVVTTLMIIYAKSTAVLLIVISIRTLLSMTTQTPLNTLQAESVMGPFVGRAMGIYNGVAQSGSVVFPLVFGFILDVSGMNFRLLFIGTAISFAVVAVLVGFMDEKKSPRKK